MPLLLNNEMFGERVTYWDMKFAKNIRFSGKRAQIGVDVYNIFNSDAITGYNGTYVDRQPGDAGGRGEHLAAADAPGLAALRPVPVPVRLLKVEKSGSREVEK